MGHTIITSDIKLPFQLNLKVKYRPNRKRSP